MDVFNIIAGIWIALVTWRVALFVRNVYRLHTLNKQVADIYRSLFVSRDPAALFAYWASLRSTCRPERLCIECQRNNLMYGEP